MTSDTTNNNDADKTVVLIAECEAPSCEYVAVIKDPETEFDAAKMLARHLNEDHDKVDRELAADYYGDWDRDSFNPYYPDGG